MNAIASSERASPVHQDKGNGFVEPVYQDALEIELEFSGIPFDAQRN